MEITIQKKIILELTKEEASWLKTYMGVSQYSDEPISIKNMREKFHYILSGEGI